MILNYGQVFWLRLLGYEFPLQYQSQHKKSLTKDNIKNVLNNMSYLQNVKVKTDDPCCP